MASLARLVLSNPFRPALQLERLPPKEEFGRMIFQKKSSVGDLNFGQQRRQLLAEALERVTPRVYKGEFWTAPLYRLE